MAKGVLTPQSEDFPRWYQDVVAKAELADNGPVRGTMVIRPWGYAIWERMQAAIDARIKATGTDNAYFPLFIPESYFRREAEHVEGFNPELAVVTHGGGKKLEEPVVVRPTSETIINSYFSKWVQSYRDLPLLINQWSNVVRWELRPRLFLRTTEFLWQEGHTAHATREEAQTFALRILQDVYRAFMVEDLAAAVLVGRKTAQERFAGATDTWTCESMMRDGKALQMGTSHELGQNFAKVFDITFLDDAGEAQFAWQTSWGASTRLMGALVMMHGDDGGLRLPPKLAPIQVAVVLVRGDDGAGDRARALANELEATGVRTRFDDRVDVSFGRRAVEWELKGVPVRLEVGPRELAEGNVVLVRRDQRALGPERAKTAVPVAEVVARVQNALAETQKALYDEANAFLEDHTSDCDTLDDAIKVAESGFARIPARLVGPEGERELNAASVSVRCLLNGNGSLAVPEDPGPAHDEPTAGGDDVVAVVGRAY